MTSTDNEQIEIFLSKIDTSKINKMYLIMNVFSSGITLDQIQKAYVNVYNDENKVVATYNLKIKMELLLEELSIQTMKVGSSLQMEQERT